MNYLTENYHTHTPRCHHAIGTEREYIEKAIEAGITTLGFADHIPLVEGSITDYSVTHIRMEMSQAKEYVALLKELKDEYKDKINILIGYEGEYFKQYNDKQIEALKEIGYDYLILGQHYLLKYGPASYTGIPTLSSKKLIDYVDTCIEALKSKQYIYFAHPDLINFIGSKNVYEKEMRRLCEFCKENDIPLEINLHGALLDRYYPKKQFFKIVGEVNNKVIFGIDAHDPNEIGNLEAYQKALALAKECHIDNFVSLKDLFE